MPVRLPGALVLVLMMAFAGDVSLMKAAEPGRLAAFAARQRIRDEVCIAMADGRIDRGERYAILTHAKAVLKPEEYEGLKKSLDRLSPLQGPATKRTAVSVANNKANASERGVASLAGASPQLTTPAGATLPDAMALADEAR